MVVIVPVKNRLDLTQNLLDLLRRHGGWSRLLFFDNGSTDGTIDWLFAQHDVELYCRPGANIHAMWNEGRELAGDEPVAILNNDIDFDAGFLQGLAAGLQLASVACPNPEGNPLLPCVEYVEHIVGYAFALAPGLPPFDERFSWYCGDDDFARQVRADGHLIASVESVRVRHIGGASTPEGLVAATKDADEALLRSKWPDAR